MKKKSRMIGVLLASVLILGTGCGKKENTTKEKRGNTDCRRSLSHLWGRTGILHFCRYKK